MAGAIAEMPGTAPSGAPDPLAGYGAGSGRSDVFTAAAPEVAAAWHAFARGLSAVGGGNIGGVQAFVDPPPANEKLVNYLAAGGIQGLRPLRFERRIARNRIIFICIVLGLLLWGLLVIFWHTR